MAHVGSSHVEVVNEVTYLAACITCDRSSESNILLHIGIARNCEVSSSTHHKDRKGEAKSRK